MMNGHSNDLMEISLPKGVPFEDYRPPNWDEFFMLKVYLTGERQMLIDRQIIIQFFFSEKIKRSSNENWCGACT
jgi:hypothetical protein